MIRKGLLTAAIAVAAVVVTATPLRAQTQGADVRTWTGQTYQLVEPTLELRYTIMVPAKGESGGPSETAPTTGAKTPMLFGSASAISQFLDKQPEPLQGRRESDAITIRKNGTDVRLPLANVSSVVFARQPAASPLPPYVAVEHHRYSATAILNDGSRVDGDYVNLGTTVLRGRTAQGRVDIPWEQIESIRFTR